MGEGYKLAVLLVICFWFTAMASLWAVACGKIPIETLKELFTGIGTLAATFGINGIIMAYVVTRGQTTSPQPGMDTSTSTSTNTTTMVPPNTTETTKSSPEKKA